MNFNKARLFLLIIPAAFLLFYLLFILAYDSMQGMEFKMQDLFFHIRYGIKGAEKESRLLRYFNLDNRDLQELDIKNSSRAVFGETITTLTRAGAKNIIFNIIFNENQAVQENDILISAVESAGNVILPLNIQNRNDIISLNAGTYDQLWYPEILQKGHPPVIYNVGYSFPDLNQAACGSGLTTACYDQDEVQRRIPLVFAFKNGYVPSLILAGICKYLEVPLYKVKIAFGKYIMLPGAESPLGFEKDWIIPVDNKGNMVIHFTGPWKKSIKSFPLREILTLNRNEGCLLKELFPNTLILVSDITTEGKDFSRGVFDSVYPNSGVFINAINTILTENFLTELSIPEKWLIVCSLIGILIITAAKFRFRSFLIFSMLTVILFFTANLGLFFLGRLPFFILPCGGILMAMTGLFLYKLFMLIYEKQEINNPNTEKGNTSPPMQTSGISDIKINIDICRKYYVTRRQKEILYLLNKEYSYEKAAEILGIRKGTVATQVLRLKESTGLNTKNELLLLFFSKKSPNLP